MICQNLSAVLSRRIRILSSVLLIAPLLLACETRGDDFRILTVREGGIDEATKRPSGQVVIGSGYAAGVEEGMSGVIWRKNKYKGQLEVADVTVVSVTAEDALCKYVLRVPDFQVLKKDKASLTPNAHQDADVLARGIAALDNGQCFDALMYFERIYCQSRDNAFVQQQIAQCLVRVESHRSGTATDEEKQAGRSRQWQNLELAEGHHAVGNELAADMYLRRVLAVDSTLARAVALRDSIPAQDLTALFSPERCK